MKQMTEQNLINAFGGESMAHLRYRYSAVQATKENYPCVARMFEAISFSEYVHACDHYRELSHLGGNAVVNCKGRFGAGDTSKNLNLAIAAEIFEIDELYPAYMATAKFQEEMGAYRSFNWSYQTEKVHKMLFEKAIEAVDKYHDVDLDILNVCSVCGYTLEGSAPEECPLCNAARERFQSF